MRNAKFNAVFLIMILAAFASSALAQKKPKPLATPPVITGAEIISQAGDYAEPAPSPTDKTPPTRTGTTNATKINDLNERLRKLEAGQNSSYDDRQKRLLMNLDILTRAEQRTESLRKQVFEMIDKENTITARLEQIEYDIRPEVIERTLQMAGSMRPEEVRENRRKNLASERANLQSLLSQVQTTRSSLELSLQKAEQMVDKLRAKAEKEIDDSLNKDDEQTKTDQQPEEK
jgi:hypothetical protein